MRAISLSEIQKLHTRIIERTGGSFGVRNLGGLESALAQPFMTYRGEYLYPTLVEKASALGFSLIMNHPFVDGNKRIGFMAMALFLSRNGYDIGGTVDEQEEIILRVASGEIDREALTLWLEENILAKGQQTE